MEAKVKEEPVPSPSISGSGGLQRTPKAEHQSRKRTVSQSSTSLSSGASSGKEGGHSTKSSSTSKHRKGEDKQGRSSREGKVCGCVSLVCLSVYVGCTPSCSTYDTIISKHTHTHTTRVPFTSCTEHYSGSSVTQNVHRLQIHLGRTHI